MTTTSTEDVLLAEIIARPDEDGPRLVYADWLCEYGGPEGELRGEYIRISCALARLAADDPNRPALVFRKVQLEDSYQRSLLVGPVRRLVSSWELHRGFAEVVRSDADLFLTRAEQILAAAPVHTVQIDASTPVMHQLADCPHLARLSGLGLTFNYLRS